MWLTRWLFSPINDASDALEALSKGYQDSKLTSPLFKEGIKLYRSIEKLQKLDWPRAEGTLTPEDTEIDIITKTQIAIDFHKLFDESNKQSCILYFDIMNLDDWNEAMTSLQLANLLTLIDRAMFQASANYIGQVHQYDGYSVVICFSARTSQDNLYIDAISIVTTLSRACKTFLEQSSIQGCPPLDFHLGLHKGGPEITEMIRSNQFDTRGIETLLKQVSHLSQSQSRNKLVISDAVLLSMIYKIVSSPAYQKSST